MIEQNLIPETDQGHLRSAAVGLYNYVCILNTPFVIYKPKLFRDGNEWCVLLGDNIQEDICAFGKSPQKAVEAFNKVWYEEDLH